MEEGSAEEEKNTCGGGKVVLHEMQNYFLCTWRKKSRSAFPRVVLSCRDAKDGNAKPLSLHVE